MGQNAFVNVAENLLRYFFGGKTTPVLGYIQLEKR